jgi:hypothetical protein
MSHQILHTIEVLRSDWKDLQEMDGLPKEGVSNQRVSASQAY